MSSVFGNTLVSGAVPHGQQQQGYMLGSAQPRQMVSAIPFTRDGKNPFESWLPFFGHPYNSDDDSRRDPYDMFNYDHKALPAAYRGRNVYLEQVIITSISEAQQWAIKKALPLMRNEKGLQIEWHQFQFDDHMLDRTPEEGVSRFVTMKETSGSDAMQRYGLGLRWENGFLQTPLGQLHFRNNLLQIINASVETMDIGACVALLQNDINKFPAFMLTDNLDRTTMAYVSKLIDEDKAGFALLNKKDGATLLLARLQTKYRRLNGASTPDANLLVIPNGSAVAYEFTHREEFTFRETGLVGGPQPTTAQKLFRGIETVESRDHYVGDGDLQTDPFYSEFAIGNFFDFTHHHIREVEPDNYKTHFMDLLAFSSDNDNYYRFSYEDFVGMCRLYEARDNNNRDEYAGGVAGRFKSTSLNGKTRWALTRFGQRFFGGHRTWGHYIKSRGGNIKAVCRGIVRDQPTFDSFKANFMAAPAPVVPAAVLPGAKFSDAIARKALSDIDQDDFFPFCIAAANFLREYRKASQVTKDAADAFPADQKAFNATSAAAYSGAATNIAKIFGRSFGFPERPALAAPTQTAYKNVGINAPDLYLGPAEASATPEKKAMQNAALLVYQTVMQSALAPPPGDFASLLAELKKPAAASLLAEAKAATDVNRSQWFFSDLVRAAFRDAAASVESNTLDTTATAKVWTERYDSSTPEGKQFVTDILAGRDVAGRSFRAREKARYEGVAADAKISGTKSAKQYMIAIRDMSKFQPIRDVLMQAAPLLYREANVGDDIDHAALRHIAKFDTADQLSLKLRLDGFCRVIKAIQTVWERRNKTITATNTVLLPLLEGLYSGSAEIKTYLTTDPEGLAVLTTDVGDSKWAAWPGTALLATAATLYNAQSAASAAAFGEVKQATFADDADGDEDSLGLPGTPGYRTTRKDGSRFSDKKQADATDIEAVLDFMPIDSGDFHMWCLQHNIYPLIKARGSRNECIYDMGTALLMRGGGAAGGTFFGHQNFSIGSDPQRKMGVGHYTLYQRSLKLEPKAVVHGWCAYSRQYVGGNGHTILDVLDRLHHDKHTRGERPASIIPVPVHLDERTEDQSIADVTGIFDPDLYDPTGSGKGALRAIPEMAPFVAHRWGIERPRNPLRRKLFGGDEGTGDGRSIHNTVMCRASTYHYNPATKQFDIEILDQGHWGPTWYAGCVKVHNAHMVSLENRWGPFSQPRGSAAGTHSFMP